MANDFIILLPNIVLALIVFAIFFFIARTLKGLVKRLTRDRRQAHNLGLVLGRLAQGATILMGLFIALSIVIPSLKASDLVQLLGISGVAIGFAFRDILQNFLAGILILLTEPFQIDDQFYSTTRPKPQMAIAASSAKAGLLAQGKFPSHLGSVGRSASWLKAKHDPILC